MRASCLVGPCRVFVASDMTAPWDRWTELGRKRGNVTAILEAGRYAFGRAGQDGGPTSPIPNDGAVAAERTADSLSYDLPAAAAPDRLGSTCGSSTRTLPQKTSDQRS